MLLLNPAMCHASVEVQFHTHVTFVLKQFGMCIHYLVSVVISFWFLNMLQIHFLVLSMHVYPIFSILVVYLSICWYAINAMHIGILLRFSHARIWMRADVVPSVMKLWPFFAFSGGRTHFWTFHHLELLYGTGIDLLTSSFTLCHPGNLTAIWIWCRYLGMAIAHIPCFFLYWFIVKAKHTYFPRMFPHAYVRTI